MGAALLAVASATPCQAGARIYMYEDENGVTHFTNVPRDRRYQPVEFDWTAYALFGPMTLAQRKQKVGAGQAVLTYGIKVE